MVTFPMTLTDPNPVFKVTAVMKSSILKTVRFKGQCYQRALIGNHTQSFEWCHFQWPWVWPLTPISSSRHFLKWLIVKTAPLKDKVTIAQEETIYLTYGIVLCLVTLTDH